MQVVEENSLELQELLSRHKTMDFEAVLRAVEANPACITWRVSVKFGISQSSVVSYLHNLSKKHLDLPIVPHIIKILQNI